MTSSSDPQIRAQAAQLVDLNVTVTNSTVTDPTVADLTKSLQKLMVDAPSGNRQASIQGAQSAAGFGKILSDRARSAGVADVAKELDYYMKEIFMALKGVLSDVGNTNARDALKKLVDSAIAASGRIEKVMEGNFEISFSK
jgi:hypothetical protein